MCLHPALSITHHYTDGIIQALCIGSASKDGLGYRDESVWVDVYSIASKYRAFLDLQVSNISNP